MDEVENRVAMVRKLFGINIDAPEARRQIWTRVRELLDLAEELERDGNSPVAETLRRICRVAAEPEAIEPGRSDHHLICLILAHGATHDVFTCDE